MTYHRLVLYACALLAAPLLACGGGDGGITDPGELPCEAPLDLDVGDTEILDPSATGSCWLFLPSRSGDRYRVGVLWESEAATAPTTESGTVDLTVLRREEATAAPPSSDAAPAPSAEDGTAGPVIPASVLGPALERMESTERVHARLRAFDAELAARLGSEALAPDLRDRNGDVALAPARAAAPEKMSFEPPYESCDLDPGAETIRGQLVLETEHLIVYQDSIQRVEQPVDSALVQRMADYYAAWGDPVIQDYFDGVSDIDGNQKVIVLVMDPPDNVGSDPAAFVLSRDLYEADDLSTPSCAASNEAELTYFSRSAINAMDDSDGSPNYQALGTLVHEVKHISSLYNRIQAGTGLHESWIEEGTAEIAAEVSSRMAWADSGGPAVGERMTRASFPQEGESAFNSANWGVLIRLARVVRTLSQQPHALTENPDLADEGHSYYGSSWHFHRFLGDAYHGGIGGIGAEAAFFRRQNTSPTSAGANFLEEEHAATMGELEEAMAFAAMANGTPAESFLGPTFSSYGFPSAAEIFCQPNPLGVYPWPVTTSGSRPVSCSGGGYDPSEEDQQPAAGFVDAAYSGSIGEGGLRIHEFVSDGTGQGIEITADVSLPGGAGGQARVLVTRIE